MICNGRSRLEALAGHRAAKRRRSDSMQASLRKFSGPIKLQLAVQF